MSKQYRKIESNRLDGVWLYWSDGDTLCEQVVRERLGDGEGCGVATFIAV